MKKSYTGLPGTDNDRPKHYKLPKGPKSNNVDLFGIRETSSEESISKSARQLASKFANSGLPGASSEPITYWYPLKSTPGSQQNVDTMGLYDTDQGMPKKAASGEKLPRGLDEKSVKLAERVLEFGKSYEEHRATENTPESIDSFEYRGKRLGNLYLELQKNGNVMLRDGNWDHYKTIYDCSDKGRKAGYCDNERLQSIKESLDRTVKQRKISSSMMSKMGCGFHITATMDVAGNKCACPSCKHQDPNFEFSSSIFDGPEDVSSKD